MSDERKGTASVRSATRPTGPTTGLSMTRSSARSVGRRGPGRGWIGGTLLGALVASGCLSAQDAGGRPFEVSSDAGTTLRGVPLGVYDQPWAMSFLPGGALLVTEKRGRLLRVDIETDERVAVKGLPEIEAEGQGGLGDVVPHPAFAANRLVYLSYVEREGRLSGAAVARARLGGDEAAPALDGFEVIWRQVPKVSGSGHYGHRLAFSPDGYLFVTSGERQKFTPAQDLDQNLGKILRLNDDGTVPDDNPFADRGDVAAEIWSLGHRNPLGLAFDADGQLWEHEMGPRGGDELNRIARGANYGYPLVSNGSHYDGVEIPDHDTRPDLTAPATSWSPVISPAGFVILGDGRYGAWAGSGVIGGLSSEALVRVELDGESAREVERFAMPTRVREVEIGPDGALYALEDKSRARLLRLDPGT